MELTPPDQDKVLYLSILDDSFLAKIIRKRIEPRHFSSTIRQHLFRAATEFFETYGKAPKDDITRVINRKITEKRIKDDDEGAIDEYLLKIFSMPSFQEQPLFDEIDLIVKERIINTTINDLLRMQDRLTTDLDKPIDLMRNAVLEIDNSTGRQVIEDIIYDPTEDLMPRDVIAPFGIPPLDKMLKGGIRKGSYTVIQAFTNVGKTWCAIHLAKMANRYGNSVLLIPTEASNSLIRLRSRMCWSGLEDDEVFKNLGRVQSIMKASMLKKSMTYIVSEEEKIMYADDVPSLVEETENISGKKISLIIFDSADELLPPRGQRYGNKREENTAIHINLKNYAKSSDIAIVTTAQITREGETKKWLGASNVAENIEKIRKATIGISMNAQIEEIKKGYFRFWLFKHTDGSVGSRCWVRHNFKIGQLVARWGFYKRDAYDTMIKEARYLEREERE